MPFLTPRLKKLYQDSIATSLFALVMIGLSVGLTFVEDWCRQMHRPEWLLVCFQGIAILLVVTDSIALLTVCIKVIIESVREVFST